VRPEVVAFRELDALVRSLTDQLAGYRRRALAAETRVKELELVSRDATEQRGAAITEIAALQASTQESAAQAARSLAQIAELETRLAAAEASRAQADGASDSLPNPFAEENAQLRARLAEAKARTSQLTDRVRFLRQQLAQGAER
jgi:chromosome segregation ATPase